MVNLVIPSCKSALLAVLLRFFAKYWVSSNRQTDTESLADHIIKQAMVSMHSSSAQARDSGNRRGHTVQQRGWHTHKFQSRQACPLGDRSRRHNMHIMGSCTECQVAVGQGPKALYARALTSLQSLYTVQDNKNLVCDQDVVCVLRGGFS